MSRAVEAAYLGAAVCFVLSLTWMSRSSNLRRGAFVAEAGILLGIVGTLLLKEIVGYPLIAASLLLGSAMGLGLMPPITLPQSTRLPLLSVGNCIAVLAAAGAVAINGLPNHVLHTKILGAIAVFALSTVSAALIADPDA